MQSPAALCTLLCKVECECLAKSVPERQLRCAADKPESPLPPLHDFHLGNESPAQGRGSAGYKWILPCLPEQKCASHKHAARAFARCRLQAAGRYRIPCALASD